MPRLEVAYIAALQLPDSEDLHDELMRVQVVLAPQPENQRVVTLKVSGMQCHLCAGTVARTAKKLTGVVAARAKEPKGAAEPPTK